MYSVCMCVCLRCVVRVLGSKSGPQTSWYVWFLAVAEVSLFSKAQLRHFDPFLLFWHPPMPEFGVSAVIKEEEKGAMLTLHA